MYKRLVILLHLSHVTRTGSCIWVFGGKHWGKEATWETLAQMEG